MDKKLQLFPSKCSSHVIYSVTNEKNRNEQKCLLQGRVCVALSDRVNLTVSDSLLDVNNSHDKQEVRAQQCDRTGSDS